MNLGGKRLRTFLFYFVIVLILLVVWFKSPALFNEKKTYDLSWFENQLSAGNM